MDSLPELFEYLKAENNITAYWKWFVILALLLALIEVIIQKFVTWTFCWSLQKLYARRTRNFTWKARYPYQKGIIEKIGTSLDTQSNSKVVEKDNLHVSLGWFDSSVSFGEPGFEERETIANGLFTAGKSGFTDIILNPNTNPVPDTSSDVVFLKERGQSKATKIYPLGTLTKNAEGVDLAELFDMKNAGAVAFYDFKNKFTIPIC